jgi:hypothetical protein
MQNLWNCTSGMLLRTVHAQSRASCSTLPSNSRRLATLKRRDTVFL